MYKLSVFFLAVIAILQACTPPSAPSPEAALLKSLGVPKEYHNAKIITEPELIEKLLINELLQSYEQSKADKDNVVTEQAASGVEVQASLNKFSKTDKLLTLSQNEFNPCPNDPDCLLLARGKKGDGCNFGNCMDPLWWRKKPGCFFLLRDKTVLEFIDNTGNPIPGVLTKVRVDKQGFSGYMVTSQSMEAKNPVAITLSLPGNFEGKIPTRSR